MTGALAPFGNLVYIYIYRHYKYTLQYFRATSNTVPYPRKVRDLPQRGKIVHIHGTNGAKFNGLNFVTTTAQSFLNDQPTSGNW